MQSLHMYERIVTFILSFSFHRPAQSSLRTVTSLYHLSVSLTLDCRRERKKRFPPIRVIEKSHFTIITVIPLASGATINYVHSLEIVNLKHPIVKFVIFTTTS